MQKSDAEPQNLKINLPRRKKFSTKFFVSEKFIQNKFTSCKAVKLVTVDEFTMSSDREFQGFTTRLHKKYFRGLASEFANKFVINL